jgi:hypothetical protein
MRIISISSSLLPLLAVALSACNPTYNWRDYRNPDAAYSVMFPAKPASYTREVDLDGIKVRMTMTAAEVEDTMFAVGSAETANAQQAQAALGAMEKALVRNIAGAVSSEKLAAEAATTGNKQTQRASIDMEASGTRNGVPMRLIAHFEARGKRIYQVVVMGKAKAIVPEQAEQFLSSFKLQ